MIKYDFMYLFYAEGQPVLQSIERPELEDCKNHQIMQMYSKDSSGGKVDEMISKKHENHPELKGFRYESSKLFLGNPKHSDDFFASEENDHGLIELDLKVTAEKMLERSSKCFGKNKKPLVILKIFYVP